MRKYNNWNDELKVELMEYLKEISLVGFENGMSKLFELRQKLERPNFRETDHDCCNNCIDDACCDAVEMNEKFIRGITYSSKCDSHRRENHERSK